MIKVSTFCSGIGAAEQALNNLNIEHEVVFACEKDKYAKLSYLANHSCNQMIDDMCVPDYIGEQYYSDLNVSGIPCQSFSLAGKRLGELDPRGLLFYDFYRWCKNQQPKVFIIENVKGLLSDNKGKTFQNWLLLLGRSVNSHEQMFIHPDSLEYNLHYTVLNSKNFGVPQNRERVFIVGIRKDLPNDFRFPIGWKLDKRLRNVLETEVAEKYYLSEKAIISVTNQTRLEKGFTKINSTIAGTLKTQANNTGDFILEVGKVNKSQDGRVFDIDGLSQCLSSGYNNSPKILVEKLGFINQDTQASQVYGTDGISPTLTSGTHGYAQGYIKEPFCVAMRGRNPDNPSDRTTGAETEQRLEANSQGITNTLTSVQKDNLIVEPQIYQTPRGFNNGGLHDICPPITSNSFQNNNHLVEPKVIQLNDSKESGGKQPYKQNRVFDGDGLSPVLDTECGRPGYLFGSRIRRLTPKECFRLQAFSDEFFYKCKAVNSDTQLYKTAGNTITVNVIQAIIKNLLHLLAYV